MRQFNRANDRTKKCPHCGLTKTIESFYQNKKTGRIYSWCKMCESESYTPKQREIKHNYYLRNKDKVIATTTQWIQNNRDKHHYYMKLYRMRLKDVYAE